MLLTDAAALAVGTLTRVPVPPPRALDRRVAGLAMLLAPVVGAVLGLVVGALAQVLVDHTATGPLLAAALGVAALAYLTRAIHLDGLADTADALGSGRPAATALEIARRSDIGPFGVVAITVVLLVQVAGLAQALDAGQAPLILAVALGSGRLTLALACLRAVPAARSDGLGAAVARSVPPIAFAAVAVGWAAVCALAAAWICGRASGSSGLPPGVVAIAAVAGALLVAAAVVRTAVRRLGGITGDVLGTTVEAGTTAALVILVGAGG